MEQENPIVINDDEKKEEPRVSKSKAYVQNYNKEYYKLNRAKTLEYMAEKIDCEVCNCQISRGKKAQHCRSKKHLQNVRIKDLEQQVKAK